MEELPKNRDRRAGDELIKFRLDKMEGEQEKTNLSLLSLDTKLDNLRSDLFERSVFVSLTTLQLELQSRDFRIQSLEATRTTNISERLIKAGLGLAILCAVISPVLSFLLSR